MKVIIVVLLICRIGEVLAFLCAMAASAYFFSKESCSAYRTELIRSLSAVWGCFKPLKWTVGMLGLISLIEIVVYIIALGIMLWDILF